MSKLLPLFHHFTFNDDDDDDLFIFPSSLLDI